MIARSAGRGFFAEHWDWAALAACLLLLAGGAAFFAMSLGVDPDQAAADEAAAVERMKPSGTGFKETDLAPYVLSMKFVTSPMTVAEVGEKDESFLSSEKRVFCGKCKKAIPGDVKAFPECPFCGEKQQEEKKVVLDADEDGLPDEWENRHGLNPGDAADANSDKDGDGFTNMEEFLAKTDPADPKDHPPYIDSLSVALPLRETKMQFVLRGAMPIGKSWKCEFFDPSRRNDYGRRGVTMRASVGEQIVAGEGKDRFETGFKVLQYTPKTVKRAVKGGEGMKRDVDVSEAVVERIKDGKRVTLVVQQGKPVRFAPIDVQATLKYERGGVKTFDVVPGSEIDLNGQKFKVVAIKPLGKGASVTLADSLTGKEYVLNALEQDGK